jgi:hypothetical protein
VEDTGLPRLLRDAQVLPIWEGTTSVLALDVLRALAAEGAPEALAAELSRLASDARDAGLRPAVEAALGASERARAFLDRADGRTREAGARGVALGLGRALEVLLLASHAQWCLDAGRGRRALAAARRLAASGLESMMPSSTEETALLLA